MYLDMSLLRSDSPSLISGIGLLYVACFLNPICLEEVPALDALEKSMADILVGIVLLCINENLSTAALGLSPGSFTYTWLIVKEFAYFYIITSMFAASADATVLFSSSRSSQNVA